MCDKLGEMSCKVIKCNHCRIVISEVLAFVQNKADVMDEEGIVRLCATTFSTDEIESAKGLLFDSLKTNKRKIIRKKVGKTERDLYDIIAVLKEADPEIIPICDARDLQRLPVLSFDHLDPTRLLKDLIILQTNMKTVLDNYVTKEQLNELKNSVFPQKLAPCFDVNNLNLKRGACLMESYNCCHSGPMGLQNYHERSLTPKNTIKSVDSHVISWQKCNESSPVSENERVNTPQASLPRAHETHTSVSLSQAQQTCSTQVKRSTVECNTKTTGSLRTCQTTWTLRGNVERCRFDAICWLAGLYVVLSR